jgi:PhnB protein
MTHTHQTTLKKDLQNKKIYVTREFDAPVSLVWRTWTESELLDQWWAPQPWKSETKSMDFREGGFWLYAMVGPDGTRHWARADYKTIRFQKSFSVKDSFCDEEGNLNSNLPSMDWKNEFIPMGDVTRVEVEISFEKDEDLKAILEMGFQEGFTAAHGNLDELLARQTV